jgi:hypothetical protein
MLEINSIFEFFALIHLLLLFFIGDATLLNFTPQVQKKIIEELEKDGMSGSITHIMHKKNISPLMGNLVGIVMLLFIASWAFILLITDIKNELNLLIALPLIVFNLFLQHKLVSYLIIISKKIRLGEKKTMLGQIDLAIQLGSIPEEMFKIYLVVTYVLHLAAILKIIF